jgi:anti-sigma regulatory factor (Ser/Thr protein kinase)
MPERAVEKTTRFRRLDRTGIDKGRDCVQKASSDRVVNQQATLELVPALRAPRAARVFVAETLTAWDLKAEKIEAAQLVVSELVTNAVLYAAKSPTISLDLRLTDGAVRVLVTDGGLGEPERRSHTDPWTAETGRGVRLVDAFAERWGTETHGRDGKTVWCELSIEAPTSR